MKLGQLEFGKVQETWLEIVHRDITTLSGLHISQKVHLWQDPSSMTFLLSQGNNVFAVEGKDYTEKQSLQNLCSLNEPRISWLADIKPKASPPLLLVISHSFPGTTLGFSGFDIAVDDKIVQDARRINRNVNSVENVIEWLTDQCFLISEGTSKKYAFFSTGKVFMGISSRKIALAAAARIISSAFL